VTADRSPAAEKIPFLYSFQSGKLVSHTWLVRWKALKPHPITGTQKKQDFPGGLTLASCWDSSEFSLSQRLGYTFTPSRWPLQLEPGELARYFDISDYVLITPIGASNFIVFFALIGFYLLTGIIKFYFPLSRRALKPTIIAFAVLLLLPILVGVIQGCWYLPPLSEVTLKGAPTNIKGHVIFSLNRYLLIYTERQNGENRSLTAIPQIEIQKIRTPYE
jgi:hypothetical protein